MTEKRLVAAFDIGTTNIECTLVGAHGGAVMSFPNPQCKFGRDVVSRITYASASDKNREELGGLLTNAVEDAAVKLLQGKNEKIDFCIVGNPYIEHSLMRYDTAALAAAPFSLVSRFGVTVSGTDIGFSRFTDSGIYLAPLLSPFVGGDITAALAALIRREGENLLLVDFGTNAEIALVCDRGVFCAAAAAGPAFEGFGAECGVSSGAGAVKHIYECNGKIKFETVDGGEPKGLCGSAVIDATALLLDCGIITKDGRIDETQSGNGVTVGAGRATFDGTALHIGGRDVRAVQLAKGAVEAGIYFVLRAAGLRETDISRVLLSGNMGTEMNPQSLARIGLLGKSLASRASGAGNTALAGAAALADENIREKAKKIADGATYIDLSAESDFNDKFVESMRFEG